MTLRALLLSAAFTGSILASHHAFAGAHPPQGGPGSRQDYAGLSNDQIRTRIVDTCVLRQWQISGTGKGAAERCGCYASRVTRAMTPVEFDDFRATGYFNETARPKAEAAVAACKVKVE